MWPDRVSNPGPLTYESGALPIVARLMDSESGTTWNNLQDRQTFTVFQIRRSNSDNLGIISHISPYKHIL